MTTYRAGSNLDPLLLGQLQKGLIIPVCPEQLGGLPTPRPPAEIYGGNANDVLNGLARILTKEGSDVTAEFLFGAEQTLHLALSVNPELVIFKENSPSCGVNCVYDGSHSGLLIQGCGVTTALLRRKGFTVISEKEFLTPRT